MASNESMRVLLDHHSMANGLYVVIVVLAQAHDSFRVPFISKPI